MDPMDPPLDPPLTHLAMYKCVWYIAIVLTRKLHHHTYITHVI